MIMVSLTRLFGVVRFGAAFSIFAVIIGVAIGLRRFGAPSGSQRLLGRVCARGLRAAGGGFVKLGKLLSTRADLLAAPFLGPLQDLQDGVSTMSIDACLHGFPPALRDRLAHEYSLVSRSPIGSGSIAQIFAARRRATGQDVVFKIVRPATRRLILRDAATLRCLVRYAAGMPAFRRWPLLESTVHCLRPICLQANMRREARLQVRGRDAFAIPGAIGVPAVIEAPHPRLLVMERMVDVGRLDRSAAMRTHALDRVLSVLFEMLFRQGLLHCDLHPGNVLICRDGMIALLDWGLCAPITTRDRRQIARFFLAMITGDAAMGTEVCMETATADAGADAAGLKADLDRLFRSIAGVPAGRFDLQAFAVALLGSQARHGFHSTSSFALPVMALTTFEGQLKQFDPDADFQRAALPAVLMALQDESLAA